MCVATMDYKTVGRSAAIWRAPRTMEDEALVASSLRRDVDAWQLFAANRQDPRRAHPRYTRALGSRRVARVHFWVVFSFCTKMKLCYH